MLGIVGVLAMACENFVEVDVPADKLTKTTVFNSDQTARSAMQGIYNELFRSASFSRGGYASVTAVGGLSSDELVPIDGTNTVYREFQENEILTNNPNNLRLWSSAYNVIYMANALLEGLAATEQVSAHLKTQLEGEARFIRAFTFFYLVNLYGDVPMVLNTDYRVNAIMGRTPVEEVYDQILNDLNEATTMLADGYLNGERTNVNRLAAEALLARVYLFRGNWEAAEAHSTQVIDQVGTYELLPNLDEVFLKNSREAIWQISPAGLGSTRSYTNEGGSFIAPNPTFAMTEQLALSFAELDKRKISWTGFNADNNTYFPHKYKDYGSANNITEYSMVLRLAEQYLIRAEARAHQEDLPGAIADLDKIKERAGLELVADTRPDIGKEQLLDEILWERRTELFTEWGHRWLDLKRTGLADAVLGTNKPTWQSTDALYPIPEEERLKNTNLSQNTGY